LPHYDIVYKCPLCERLLRLGKAVDLKYEQLPELLGKIIANQRFAGHPILYEAPMYVSCQCSDGNAGLACIAGLLKV